MGLRSRIVAPIAAWIGLQVARGTAVSFGLGCATGLVLALLAAILAGLSAVGVADALAGLMTPLIAIIGAYIAYQQWRTSRDEFNMERYPARLVIYEKVRSILSQIVRDADVTTPEMIAFWKSISEADFLFGADIHAYLDEIYRRGMNLSAYTAAHNQHLLRPTDQAAHEQNVANMQSEVAWFMQQPEAARVKFRKYMQIRD